jgi:FAD/FMN-containing dehydrogenase
MQHINFETFISHNDTLSACYLDTTLGVPCEQGSIPPVGVDARSGSDVQAAVNFAKQHNLKVVVKATGHDFLGRSTARGSFLIWTHNMKQTLYNPTFVPEGAPVTTENTFNGDLPFMVSHFQLLIISYLLYISAITFGAGVLWSEAFDFIEKHGQFVVGGAVASVGAAGGWVMGGGHSALSPAFGLGTVISHLSCSLLNP